MYLTFKQAKIKYLQFYCRLRPCSCHTWCYILLQMLFLELTEPCTTARVCQTTCVIVKLPQNRLCVQTQMLGHLLTDETVLVN